MNYIGIDIGTSNIKMVEVDEKLIIKNKLILEKMEPMKALQEFINKNNIELKNIEKIIATGVGANGLGNEFKEIEIVKVPEFIAIANGGKLANLNGDFLVVSIGTGTAFIKYENKEITHIGGTGVGGGTLINLCRNIVPNISFEEINKSIKQGSLDNVDLMIKDITNEKIKTLPMDTTAANFGRLNKSVKSEDIIKGFANMIFESIGVMAAFGAKSSNIKTIIVIGQLAKMPFAREVLDKIEVLHNVKFIIPENPEFLVSIGAIKERLKNCEM